MSFKGLAIVEHSKAAVIIFAQKQSHTSRAEAPCDTAGPCYAIMTAISE